jgi:hypothetical protein
VTSIPEISLIVAFAREIYRNHQYLLGGTL